MNTVNNAASSVYNGANDMFNVVYAATYQLIMDVLRAIPFLFAAIIIWWIGNMVINAAVSLMKKVDFRGTRFDDKLMGILIPIVQYAGKFFLVLIVMDYLGIGETVIGSILNAMTFGIAIALGIAGGKAFEMDAKSIYDEVRRKIMAK